LLKPSEPEVQLPDQEFTAIRIEDFFTGKTTLFDIYFKLGTGRYQRALAVGEAYNENLMNEYREEKGLKYLYIPAQDRQKFIVQSQKLLERIAGLKEIPSKTKFAVARNLLWKYMEQLYSDGPSEELLAQGAVCCHAVAGLFEKDPAIPAILMDFDQCDSSIYSQAFLAGMFAGIISRSFDWSSRQITESMLFSALLCDIGLTKLSPELLRIKPAKMSKSQRMEYEKHPALSVSMVDKSRHVNKTVQQIVQQHQEYCDGSGFPQALTADRLLLLSKVISLTGDFARCALDNLLSPRNALDLMFPLRTDKVFIDPPAFFAKYDRSVLTTLFLIFDGKKKEK
jgi:HD-GYP domain-containing protein (c-di-GMP phosphodiesterase class II)